VSTALRRSRLPFRALKGSRSILARVRAILPQGNAITPESWDRRHRAIVALTWIHVPALFLVGVERGYGVVHPLLEVALIVAFAVGAGIHSLSPDARASLATMGLVASSGVLVHMTGGLIEMHFHFFVVVAIVALYQSWFPFLVAIAFVLFHHGVIGGMDAASVYNHAAALRNPWKWAALHALFIAGESAAALTAWKLNEMSIDAERTTRADLEAAVADLSEAQALTHIGSWDWDTASERLVWSDESYRICGLAHDVDPTFERFMELVVEEEREVVREKITASVTSRVDVEYECHITRPDGTLRLILGLGRTTVAESGSARLVGTIQDVTERKQALHDPLTGLPNRTLFLDRVAHARTQQERDMSVLGLLFVDLDDFKTVNDTKGHLAGDDLLRRAGSRISAVLRPGDTVARLGGDEFVVLLNGIDGIDDATRVADRILEALSDAQSSGDGASTAASIGIVVEPPPGSRTPDELLRDADVAMYAAKRRGKGTWQTYDDDVRHALPAIPTLAGDRRSS
jgi:diguanylate cyclase (GGDEF)-like protein/PAS domain S-box-containing protein